MPSPCLTKIVPILGDGLVQRAPSPRPSMIDSSEEEPVLKKPKIVRLGFFSQLWVFIRREFVLQLRMSRTLLLDQALILVAGAALGLLFREVGVVLQNRNQENSRHVCGSGMLHNV